MSFSSFPTFPMFPPRKNTPQSAPTPPSPLTFRIPPTLRPQPAGSAGYDKVVTVSYGITTCPLCMGGHYEVYELLATNVTSGAQWMGCVQCLATHAMNYLLGGAVEAEERRGGPTVDYAALLSTARQVITSPTSAEAVEAVVQAIDRALRAIVVRGQ